MNMYQNMKTMGNGINQLANSLITWYLVIANAVVSNYLFRNAKPLITVNILHREHDNWMMHILAGKWNQCFSRQIYIFSGNWLWHKEHNNM